MCLLVSYASAPFPRSLFPFPIIVFLRTAPPASFDFRAEKTRAEGEVGNSRAGRQLLHFRESRRPGSGANAPAFEGVDPARRVGNRLISCGLSHAAGFTFAASIVCMCV